jgi:hypothetical protein
VFELFDKPRCCCCSCCCCCFCRLRLTPAGPAVRCVTFWAQALASRISLDMDPTSPSALTTASQPAQQHTRVRGYTHACSGCNLRTPSLPYAPCSCA